MEISDILPTVRKTVELAQYQVATVGAPVDLLYHIGSSESPTYHRARSASYTWGVTRYIFFVTYIYRHYLKNISFIIRNSFYALLHRYKGVIVNSKFYHFFRYKTVTIICSSASFQNQFIVTIICLFSKSKIQILPPAVIKTQKV